MHNIQFLAKNLNIAIKELSSDDKEKMKLSAQAQKRTAHYKKAVFVFPHLVFKGPYTKDDIKLHHNLIYNYAIQQLETLLGLEEKYKATLPWEYLGFHGKDYYLAAKNIGNWDKAIVEKVSSKIETNVNVVKRGTMVFRISELEKETTLSNDFKIACLQHLYLRFILNIGDSGTYNILQREDNSSQLIVGIDLEERRKYVPKNSLLELLLKKCSKLQKEIYSPFLKQIQILSINSIPQQLWEKFETLGVNTQTLKSHIELWQKKAL